MRKTARALNAVVCTAVGLKLPFAKTLMAMAKPHGNEVRDLLGFGPTSLAWMGGHQTPFGRVSPEPRYLRANVQAAIMLAELRFTNTYDSRWR